MSNVLTVATAGRTPNQLKDRTHTNHPRTDYVELQRLLDMHLLDYNAYNATAIGRLVSFIETQVRSDLYLTLLALIEQRKHASIFAMSERVGIPYTALARAMPARKPLVAMFQCWSPRQEFVTSRLDLFASMDAIIVHCQSMKQHLVDLKARADRIHVIPYSVDQQFFTPRPTTAPLGNYIFAAGEPRSRNYASMLRTVEGLPLHLRMAATGHWYSREKETFSLPSVPANVSLGSHYRPAELRNLYAGCRFVVLPIKDLVYSGGATVLLESMCMGKAVIVTRSRGIAQYVKDGETALLVEQGDEAGLRAAIEHLWAHPEEARRLGQNGRQWVEDELNLDRYVMAMATVLQGVVETRNVLPERQHSSSANRPEMASRIDP